MKGTSIIISIIFALFIALVGLAPPDGNVNTDQSITIDAIGQNASVEFQMQAQLIMPVICRSDQIELYKSFKLNENYLEQAFIPSNANNNEETVFQRNKHYARNHLKEWVINYWYPLKYPIKV